MILHPEESKPNYEHIKLIYQVIILVVKNWKYLLQEVHVGCFFVIALRGSFNPVWEFLDGIVDYFFIQYHLLSFNETGQNGNDSLWVNLTVGKVALLPFFSLLVSLFLVEDLYMDRRIRLVRSTRRQIVQVKSLLHCFFQFWYHAILDLRVFLLSWWLLFRLLK